MKKNCENKKCNKKFEGNAKARFCSPSCRVAANRANNATGKKVEQVKKLDPTLKKASEVKSRKKGMGVSFKDGKLEVPANSNVAKILDQLPVNSDNGAKLLFDAPVPEWVEKVEKFCNKNNCTVDDLIEAYQNRGKKLSLKDMKEDDKKGKKGTRQEGEARPIFDRRKQKLGF
jgi:predicted HNH restriction endonuclease